ncbi:MAG: Hsp20/alpha crystallin family protein [Burkholderiales bacterium]|nr:Hsp20/alpha crystallin family protein [Burkholderiales bacterium]
MTTRDSTARMWAEACRMLEQADRLHRQFFRFDRLGAPPAWEPPVDVFEDEREIAVVVALPGVAHGAAEVALERGALLIRAERRVPFDDRARDIRRLEIPHGRFERRVPLPAAALTAAGTRWVDGCLVVILRKR